MTGSIFAQSAADRKKDQEKKMAANDLIDARLATKVRINFSLSSEANDKMKKKAEEMGISKSALLQLWIHQNCD